jgi:hypothetical protein
MLVPTGMRLINNRTCKLLASRYSTLLYCREESCLCTYSIRDWEFRPTRRKDAASAAIDKTRQSSSSSESSHKDRRERRAKEVTRSNRSPKEDSEFRQHLISSRPPLEKHIHNIILSVTVNAVSALSI